MMAVVDWSLPRRRRSRSRHTMCSMAMMASSTMTPTAITNPASTIVLRVAPRRDSTRAAASSDSGIATRLISAVRHEARKAPSASTTSIPPRSRATPIFSNAISMKVAARKIRGSTSTPGSPSRNASSAASTPRVTSRVLVPGNFSTSIKRPVLPLWNASPMSSG